MTSYVTPRKNVAHKFYVSLVDQSNTKLLKANPTIASGDFKVSTDGGAFANLATLPSANPASGRAIMIDLSSGEMNGDNIVVQCVDAAGAEWCDLLVNIQTTARQIDDLAFPATTGRSMVVDASGLVDANTVKVGPTGSGTAQTARDVGASVLLSAGTGTGQLDFTSGVVKANATQWLGGTIPAVNVTGVPLIDLKYTLGTISPATAGSVRADAVTGAVGSVTARVTANTDQLAGQTVTAAAGVTFPTSVASPTNITAGTITTATNVTNISTGGIVAASFAAGAIDAAAIATDAIDADALKADAVTEIQSGLSTLTQANIRTAVGLASANLDTQLAGISAPTAAAVADAVWDEAIAGHLTAGTTGLALNSAGSAGDPWATALPGAYGAGTAGKIIGDNIDATISSRTKPADTQAAVTTVTNLTNAPTSGDLTATMKTSVTTAATAATPTVAGVSGVTFPASVASPTNITAGTITTVTNLTNAPTAGDLTATMKTSVTTAATAATPTVTAGTVSDKTGYRLSATGVDDVLDEVVDGTTTLRESVRLHNATLGGKASGLATTNVAYRDLADSKDRVSATVDADGNRTAVTLDLTP